MVLEVHEPTDLCRNEFGITEGDGTSVDIVVGAWGNIEPYPVVGEWLYVEISITFCSCRSADTSPLRRAR